MLCDIVPNETRGRYRSISSKHALHVDSTMKKPAIPLTKLHNSYQTTWTYTAACISSSLEIAWHVDEPYHVDSIQTMVTCIQSGLIQQTKRHHDPILYTYLSFCLCHLCMLISDLVVDISTSSKIPTQSNRRSMSVTSQNFRVIYAIVNKQKLSFSLFYQIHYNGH